MNTFSVANAATIIEAAKPILRRGSWGDGTEAVCMMSALVKRATSDNDCVTAGWPEWLSILNHTLFDSDVGAKNEDEAAFDFALGVAKALEHPVDTDAARDRFMIKRLETGDYSALKSLRANKFDADWWRDCEAAVLRVADLLKRRIAGENVAGKMKAARAAARSAADAAAGAAAGAARAAARAAYAVARATYAVADAAYAARAAADAAYAAYAAARAAARSAADAAADAARAAARAAADAAYAAARADLIEALNESRIEGGKG